MRLRHPLTRAAAAGLIIAIIASAALLGRAQGQGIDPRRDCALMGAGTLHEGEVWENPFAAGPPPLWSTVTIRARPIWEAGRVFSTALVRFGDGHVEHVVLAAWDPPQTVRRDAASVWRVEAVSGRIDFSAITCGLWAPPTLTPTRTRTPTATRTPTPPRTPTLLPTPAGTPTPVPGRCPERFLGRIPGPGGWPEVEFERFAVREIRSQAVSWDEWHHLGLIAADRMAPLDLPFPLEPELHFYVRLGWTGLDGSLMGDPGYSMWIANWHHWHGSPEAHLYWGGPDRYLGAQKTTQPRSLLGVLAGRQGVSAVQECWYVADERELFAPATATAGAQARATAQAATAQARQTAAAPTAMAATVEAIARRMRTPIPIPTMAPAPTDPGTRFELVPRGRACFAVIPQVALIGFDGLQLCVDRFALDLEIFGVDVGAVAWAVLVVGTAGLIWRWLR